MFRSIQSRRDAKVLLQSPGEGEPNPRAALRELAKRHLALAEFVVIDASFEDAAAVIASLPRDIPCALLPAEKGLRALLDALSGRTIDVLHVFCGGTIDSLRVGGETISLGAPVARDAAMLDVLRTTFSRSSPDGPIIQLYGSAFGLGGAGRAAAATLARLAKANVAATADAASSGPEVPVWHLQLVRSVDADNVAKNAQTHAEVHAPHVTPEASGASNEQPPIPLTEVTRSETANEAVSRHLMADVSLHNPRVQFHRNARAIEASQENDEAVNDGAPPIDGLTAFSPPKEDFPVAALAALSDDGASAPTDIETLAEASGTRADMPPAPSGEVVLRALTLEACVRPNDIDAEEAVVELGDADGEVRLVLDGPLLTFGVSRMPAYAEAVADLSVLGIEDHSTALTSIAASVDETGFLKLYVCGALAGTARLAPRDLSWTICDGAPDPAGFDGEVAVLRLYDRALTAAEIAAFGDASKPASGMVWEAGTRVDRGITETKAELEQQRRESNHSEASGATEIAATPAVAGERAEVSRKEATHSEARTSKAGGIEPSESAPRVKSVPTDPALRVLRSSARVRAMTFRSAARDRAGRLATIVLEPGAELSVDVPSVTGCALGDAVTFWSVRAPEWVELDARTGRLGGIVPAGHAPGSHSLVVVAANDRGATATLHLVVVVKSVAPSAPSVEDRLRSSLDSLPALRALSAAGRIVAPTEEGNERAG